MAERPELQQYKRLATSAVASIFLAFAVSVLPDGASAQDLYAVSDIEVDESADSEVAAKQAGIAKAKRDAFRSVLRRLTLPGAIAGDAAAAPATSASEGIPVDGTTAMADPASPQGQVALPDAERLEFLIRDVSFQEEKFGGGRYLATMTVRFHPQEVNRYLQRSGVAYLGAPSPLAVVLPIFRQDGSDILWSDANPWLDAWWRVEREGVVVPYTVPLGDLSDIAAIDAARAVAVDPAGINGIAARYNAGAVVIPIATFGEGDRVLVELATFGAGWPGQPELLTFSREALTARADALRDPDAPPPADESELYAEPVLLHAAASLVLDALDSRWKQANILRFDQDAETLTARIGLRGGLSDWLSLKGALNSIAPIKTWRLAELATGHAVVEIDYVGGTDRLNQALARRSMTLVPGEEGEDWQMLRR